MHHWRKLAMHCPKNNLNPVYKRSLSWLEQMQWFTVRVCSFHMYLKKSRMSAKNGYAYSTPVVLRSWVIFWSTLASPPIKESFLTAVLGSGCKSSTLHYSKFSYVLTVAWKVSLRMNVKMFSQHPNSNGQICKLQQQFFSNFFGSAASLKKLHNIFKDQSCEVPLCRGLWVLIAQ